MKKQLKPVYFLKKNVSLKAENRKLINLLIHELLQTLSVMYLSKEQRQETFELSVSRFHLHNTLDMKGKTKFRLSKVVNELKSTHLYLSSHSSAPLFTEISLDNKDITFKFNKHYNSVLFDTNVFAIDIEIQRQINRKNTLFLYEFCMSQLSEIKNSVTDEEIVIFERSLSEIKSVLGPDDYDQMRNIDIFRSVFKVSTEDLNRIKPGFSINVTSNKMNGLIDSLTFTLEIKDANYINRLLAI